jgi:hypothetical protein
MKKYKRNNLNKNNYVYNTPNNSNNDNDEYINSNKN